MFQAGFILPVSYPLDIEKCLDKNILMFYQRLYEYGLFEISRMQNEKR